MWKLFFHDIKTTAESSVDLASTKAHIRYGVFILLNFYKDSCLQEQFESCKLKSENNCVIQKPDKYCSYSR